MPNAKMFSILGKHGREHGVLDKEEDASIARVEEEEANTRVLLGVGINIRGILGAMHEALEPPFTKGGQWSSTQVSCDTHPSKLYGSNVSNKRGNVAQRTSPRLRASGQACANARWSLKKGLHTHMR